MPFVPSACERLLLGRLNLAPGLLFDVISAGTFRALAVAIDHGLFEALRDGPRTAAELAGRVGAHPEAMRILVECLATLRGQTYDFRDVSRWLVDAGFETPHYRSARGVQLALATKAG